METEQIVTGFYKRFDDTGEEHGHEIESFYNSVRYHVHSHPHTEPHGHTLDELTEHDPDMSDIYYTED